MNRTKLKWSDVILFLLIVFNLLFFRYFNVFYEEFYLFDALIIVYILINIFGKKFFKISITSLLSFLLLIAILNINAVLFGFNKIMIKNLLMIFSPIVYIFYLKYLIKIYNIAILKILADKTRILLNTYFVINTIIIYIQALTGTFMMKRFIPINTNAFDHMDGFIGVNGVSILNFLWIATILFNLYHYYSTKKKVTLITTIIQFILMAHISILNENKMFYMTIFIFLAFFFVLNFIKEKMTIKYVLKTLVLLILAPVLFISIINLPFLSDEFENSANLVDQFIYDGITVPDKHNERAYLNYMAFELYDAYKYGIGLQSIDLDNQNIHIHLGINSSSLILMQGGLILLIGIINFYSISLLKLFPEYKGLKKFIIYLLIMTTFAVMSFATQVFRDHYIAISVTLIYFALFLIGKRENREEV